MTTMQQERPMVGGAPSTTRRPWLMTGMLVIGLLIGLLGGWLIFGSDDVMTLDGSELTERQIEMIEMIDQDFAAWQANDVDTVLSHYTDSGVFVTDREYLVRDGSLAGFVRFFSGAPMMEPVGQKLMVDDITVISFHTYAAHTYTNVFRFKAVGDVLITRHHVIG